MNPLIKLHENFGQSPWLDSIDRGLITSGKLQDLVNNHGLRGLTSNPSIFEKAMTHSNLYDEQIESLLSKDDWEVKALYEELAITDIQAAADILRPIYEMSDKQDGMVSFEVSPWLARDTNGTIQEAIRLWKKIDRPNAMIKIPGTNEGIPAIRALIAEGININITLLFSRAMYRRVVQAYLQGLEDRVKSGQSIHDIMSVASFFVSRIDSAIDKIPAAKELAGQVAIANAKLAYFYYQEVFEESASWHRLAALGGRPQRLLWASTSTKNPKYSDVMYIEALIGKNTINTMPPSTMQAFEDHGKLQESLTVDLNQAKRVLFQLSESGVSLDDVTDLLTEDAIRLFGEPFDQLMASLERKKRRRPQLKLNSMSLRIPVRETTQIGKTLQEWRQDGKLRKLWNHDASLWTGQDESKWLGWLRSIDTELKRAKELKQFFSETVKDSIDDIVLLGMGGSSLAPEVFQDTFERLSNRPRFHILDSTDPDQIGRIEKSIDLSRTLFIVSSKSGTTLEPNLFLEYFFSKTKNALGENEVGKRFIAITDPGSQLEKVAKNRRFLRSFHGNPEIGGRYSALSPFGTIPAGLMGIELENLLKRAKEMVHSCSENVPPEENPGAILGATLGTLALGGRNKITLFCSHEVGELGPWLEQLLAESTGKKGKGLIPISEEEMGLPESYGEDRLFVYFSIAAHSVSLADRELDQEMDRKIDALEKFGHPLIRIELEDAYSIGQEFFRWEMATAVAGSILGVNPFDQPDVEASKVETRKLTNEIEKTGELPKEQEEAGEPQEDILRSFLDQIQAHDYFAILAYLDMNLQHKEILQEIREMVRSSRKIATCLGFGPRFLHSTGQLYKGGANEGVFLQITADPLHDLQIPGHAYSFGQVEAAQARGDFEILKQRKRRCLRIHLNHTSSLEKLREVVRMALISHKRGVAA